jgi:uncharacterized repeat protein (TIGR03803 family)
MMGLISARRLFRSLVALLTLLVFSQHSQAQTYAIVHSFAGAPTDGDKPNGDLIRDAAGNLYGTSFQGGTHDLGVVFKLDPSGAETILYNFTGAADGSHPEAGLFQDPTGNLYGMTTEGGSEGLGTVFAVDTNDVLTSLHSFKGVPDGAQPISKLVSINGDLYGVTQYGGISSGSCAGSCGTVFKVTKGGKETVLYRFTPGADGGNPQSVIRDSAGNLYGLATGGGGRVFKLDATGVFTVLYAFTGGASSPVGRPTLDANGNIRGVTEFGGTHPCCGIIFRLDADGQLTTIHNFSRDAEGYRPYAGLLDAGGTLYGTARYGGDFDLGVLFEINNTGQYTVIHSFAGTGAGDGEDSQVGGVTLGSDGSIYGATWHGGTGKCKGGSYPGCGVIFKYTP